jgi:hypothetical protein
LSVQHPRKVPDRALIVGAFVAKLRLEKGEAAVARWLEQM